MKVIDKILQEWSYRCHDGIVDINDPKKKAILDQILKENNIDFLNEGQDEEDLTNIFKIVGDDKNLTKTEIFDELSKYTLKYYSNTPEMQDLIKVFPNYVNNIDDWRQYVPEEEKKDNRGKEVEVFLKNYAIKQGVSSELVPGGRGKDVKIGNATVESKSNAGNTINTQLQTTYYSSNTYYAFVNRLFFHQLHHWLHKV